ncbi:MAG: hypothetical protein V3R87_04305 [Dehalococcoidia bacterium]
MSDALFISGVGIGMAYAVLAIMMFMTMGLVRFYRGKKASPDANGGGGGEQETMLGGGRSESGAAPAAGTWQLAGPGGTLMTTGAEQQLRPEDATEAVAIVLALAAHLGERGQELGGRPILIGDAEYVVALTDPWSSPVAVMIDGERCWGSLDGTGLPVDRTTVSTIRPQRSEAQSGRQWRSAQPIGQAGYWDRRGWSRRM